MKLRSMRSDMDVAATNAEERIRRLENNVRVLCQNIENSNSILNMKQGSGGGKKNKTLSSSSSSSEEQGEAAEIMMEDQIYDDRTIDVR